MSPHGINQNRLIYIDYLRALIFMMLALDHSVHAYAQRWGGLHFITDFDRTVIFDVFYMVSNSIIMPMIFFISGLFVIPSIQKNGAGGFLKNRLVHLGIPFVLGVIFITPLLQYASFHDQEDPMVSYGAYWFEHYFPYNLSASGPFWVLWVLFFYSLILMILYLLFPGLIRGLGALVSKVVKRPILFCISFLMLLIAIASITDLIWGAPWWFRVWWFFSLQGSRFLIQALFFLLGSAVMESGILHEKEWLQRFASKWFGFFMIAIVMGVAYVGFSLSFIEDGAYDSSFRKALNQKESFETLWTIFIDHSQLSFLRTVLFSGFIFSQFIFYMALGYRFLNHSNSLWRNLSLNTYGIFLLHEVPVIWLQYVLISSSLPLLIKIGVVFIVGVGGTWLIVDKVLRRFKLVRQVLN